MGLPCPKVRKIKRKKRNHMEPERRNYFSSRREVMKNKMKEELIKMDFDSYIFECFNKFLNTEGNFIQTEYGKHLKDGVEYLWTYSSNRNPKQVPDGVWQRILWEHLKRTNYN